MMSKSSSDGGNTLLEKLIFDREWFDSFLLRSIFHSAAIEGNTITLEETQSLLLEGVVPNFRRHVSLREIHELVNLKRAWKYLLGFSEPIHITLMHELHRIVMNNIDDESGQFKRTQNIVGATLTSKPENVSTEVFYLVEQFYNGWLTYAKTDKDKIRAIAEFHIAYEHIHPYQDGNGRTGRLLMNYLLICREMMPIVIRVEDRAQYYTWISNRDVEGFVNYMEDQIRHEQSILNRNGK